MRITTREVLDWKAIEERRNRSQIPLVTECMDCGRIIDDGKTYCEGCALRHRLHERDVGPARSVYQRRLIP